MFGSRNWISLSAVLVLCGYTLATVNQCANECTWTASAYAGCAGMDINCACTSPEFQVGFRTCVEDKCSFNDAAEGLRFFAHMCQPDRVHEDRPEYNNGPKAQHAVAGPARGHSRGRAHAHHRHARAESADPHSGSSTPSAGPTSASSAPSSADPTSGSNTPTSAASSPTSAHTSASETSAASAPTSQSASHSVSASNSVASSSKPADNSSASKTSVTVSNNSKATSSPPPSSTIIVTQTQQSPSVVPPVTQPDSTLSIPATVGHSTPAAQSNSVSINPTVSMPAAISTHTDPVNTSNAAVGLRPIEFPIEAIVAVVGVFAGALLL